MCAAGDGDAPKVQQLIQVQALRPSEEEPRVPQGRAYRLTPRDACVGICKTGAVDLEASDARGRTALILAARSAKAPTRGDLHSDGTCYK
jgi:hypothetical protein